ncbi:MAG: hypothetical protein CMJ31_10880 [Phycisphaerae bacterium]|nr:hypothetical protein [Phycisphaerae bacterium]
MTSDTEPVLKMEAIAGPPIDTIVVAADRPVVFGRSSAADRQLADKTVSRRHCRITARGGEWFIADLDSRHGAFLNGVRLDPEQPAPVLDGDLVRIGPWTFRVRTGSDSAGTSMPTSNDLATTSHRVQRVPVRELRSMAEQRLDLVLEGAAAINAATTLQDLAERVLDAVCQGTRFKRAAFIRPVSAVGEIELIAARAPLDDDSAEGEINHQPDAGAFTFSRSLINAASEGEIVRIQGEAEMNHSESIVRLGISSALCAPVMLGGSVEAYIYLDARSGATNAEADAAAFCQAISRMAGLALGNIKRVELEKAQSRIASDLRAAREAQRLIMPPPMGEIGRYSYALQSRPGRHVAGDLFEIVPLGEEGDPDRPVGVLIGDVAGKGAGAGILMAAAQTMLRMSLRHSADPAEVVSEANAYLAAHIADRSFISLWLGVLDPRAGQMSFVDAGHGHWMILDPAGEERKVECEGGLIVGVQADFPYKTETIPLEPGSRLILFSDGLVEQPDPDGVQFGSKRVIEVIRGPGDARSDVKRLADAVRSHAQTDAIADDFTVASVVVQPQ